MSSNSKSFINLIASFVINGLEYECVWMCMYVFNIVFAHCICLLYVICP